jgi:hypothetical protein
MKNIYVLPKEEPKPLPDVNWQSDIINKVWDKKEPKQEYNNLNYGGGFTEEDIERVVTKKKESLEEVANRTYPKQCDASNNCDCNWCIEMLHSRKAFIEGANWQQKRMFSEEEVRAIFTIGQMVKAYGDYKPYTFEEALKQFKKK